MKKPLDPFNQKRSAAAQRRILTAITQLEAQQQLPAAITARANAIRALSSVSFQTLYRHRHLWHPDHQS